MQHLLDTTELLIASWILGGDTDQIPTSRGILDRALQVAVKDKTCPSWVRDKLHFVDSRIGLQCVELPALLALSLLSNAALAWNTVQIGDLVDGLEARGEAVSRETLARVSPLVHRHIIPSGTYRFRDQRARLE